MSGGLASGPREHTCEIRAQRDRLGPGALAGGLGQAEAKDPINSCGPREDQRGCFSRARRGVKATVDLELYLRKIRIIYQLPAGRHGGGHVGRGAEAQTCGQEASLGSARAARPPELGAGGGPHPAP